MRRLLFACLLPLLTAAPSRADQPTAEELSHCFRSLLLPNLPDPLVQQSFNWDHQEMVTVGYKWNTKGVMPRFEPQKKMHNDGHWKKVNVTSVDPQKNLEVRIRDVKLAEPGRLTFAMQIHLPVRVKFEQQMWRKGTRLYSGESRARARVIFDLQCESISRFDTAKGSVIPDLVMRLRVLDAKLNYYDFVVEHTAGLGGDAAKILGDTVHDMVKSWNPSLEKDLLEKANKAIVKAGDTKEVRLGFGKLLGQK